MMLCHFTSKRTGEHNALDAAFSCIRTDHNAGITSKQCLQPAGTEYAAIHRFVQL